MSKKVLITGGAGFIGSHVAEDLLQAGYGVRALDNLDPQIHGHGAGRPSYLDPEVELIRGDVRDASVLRAAIDGVDAVIHLAAAVGIGQSMYEISKYVDTNSRATAVLLEVLLENPVEKFLVASSMSIYGEGLYRSADGRLLEGEDRPLPQLLRGVWELHDDSGKRLEPVPTPETKRPSLSSVYALTKYDQERLCLIFGRSYRIPTVALRFFNVYGTRQALSNPYTGVFAMFTSRYLNGKAPVIYEDGEQRRDFVHVKDAARACRLALEAEDAAGKAYNIGSGRSMSVLEVANLMGRCLGKERILPEVSAKYRACDVRHCFADIGLAREELGYSPRFTLEDSLPELASWLEGQSSHDAFDRAQAELGVRGRAVAFPVPF